jgi:DNA-directed RNA polymerase beta' subunit
MKLRLLDIEDYISANKLKPVTSIRLYEKIEKTDPNGLFSEEIFGKFGSTERRKKFAYINLGVKVIHPEVFSIIASLDTTISKCLINKATFSITETGVLVEDPEGASGVQFFISIFDKLNLKKYEKNKPKQVKFIKENRNRIFISKYLVLPAGIRDLSISKTSKQVLVNFSDLSELYTNLIRYTHTLGSNIESVPIEIKNIVTEQIQKTTIEINNWIKDRLKGKTGVIRGGLFKKVVDYSGRLLIGTDHTLPLGTVGLPWPVVLKLYEPFAVNKILKKDQNMLKSIQYMMRLNDNLSVNDLKRLISKMVDDSKFVPNNMAKYFKLLAEEIIKDKVVLYKRDPVENRDSWLAANIRVDNIGSGIFLNPLDLPRIGGDHDGDAIAVLSLFTKEAQEEAKKKIHPQFATSTWTSVTSVNQCPYQITLDAMSAIYAATK